MKKHNINNSLNLYKKAEKIIPGKTQLISRRSSQFAHGINPIYAKESKGGYFIDVDDNKYLDWMNAVSAIILGHSHDYVDNAVKEQIDKGSIHTVNSALELELADLLIEEIPSAEMVRYTKGGGDSCALAVRIARGTTGREKILFSGDTLFYYGCGRIFEGTYEQMLESLNKLKKLPNDTKVYCGHEYTYKNLEFVIDELVYWQNSGAVKQKTREMIKKRGSSMPFELGNQKNWNPFLNCDSPHYKQGIADFPKNEGKISKEASEIEFFTFIRDKRNEF